MPLLWRCSPSRTSPELLFIHWINHSQILPVNTCAEAHQASEEQIFNSHWHSGHFSVSWSGYQIKKYMLTLYAEEGALQMAGRQMHGLHFREELWIFALLYLSSSPAILKRRHNWQSVSCSKHGESQAAILVSSLKLLQKCHTFLMSKRPISTTSSGTFWVLCSPFFPTIASYVVLFFQCQKCNCWNSLFGKIIFLKNG